MSDYFDVVVIGVGPAGLASAILCQQAGLSTLVISNREIKNSDPDNAPSNKPLESVHEGILALLKRLNTPAAIQKSALSTFTDIKIGSSLQNVGQSSGEIWNGFHISRFTFDNYLLKCAIEQGTSVLSNQTVYRLIKHKDRVDGVQTKSGKILKSRFLIDCSGKNRCAGKLLKLKEVFYSRPLWSWTGKVERIPKKVFSQLKTSFIPNSAGWVWIAPEPPNSCSWTQLSTIRDFKIIPPLNLLEFSLVGNIQVANVRWRIFRPLVKEGVILAGDAAGIIDPASGQGILNALWSGIMASQAVINSIKNPETESLQMALYDQWYFDRFEYLAQQLKLYYQFHGIRIN